MKGNNEVTERKQMESRNVKIKIKEKRKTVATHCQSFFTG